MVKGEQVTKTKPVRIMVVEDHPIVRAGLRQLIGQESDLLVCGEAESAAEAISKFEELNPDIVLLDLSLREGDGWEVMVYIRRHWVGAKIIVVSSWDEIHTKAALEAGAMGYVSKYEASEKVLDAIRCVARGESFCTVTRRKT